MKIKEIEKGVAVMLNDMFWGTPIGHKNPRWTSFRHAKIAQSEFCKKPTDLTWDPNRNYNPFYSELEKGTLVEVVRTTTVEMEIVETDKPEK